MSAHNSHPDIIKRLKRAHGHLAKVIAMIEADEPCLMIAQQLHAVANAVGNAKQILVTDHIEHCFAEAIETMPRNAQVSLDEFKEIAKYL